MQQDERSICKQRPWRIWTAGMLLGMLAAGSASSQGEVARATNASSETVSHVAVATVGTAREVRLADGRRLTLSADGRVLTVLKKEETESRRSYQLTPARVNASMAVLPSGRVLIWGGKDRAGGLQDGGLWFDPELGSLDRADSVALSARAGHSATVLTDGRLLVVGGTTTGPDAELWDEGTGRVLPIRMAQPVPRLVRRAQLLADGRVRIESPVSGRSAATHALLFDPVRNAFAPAGEKGPTAQNGGLAGSLPKHGDQNVAPEVRIAVRFTEPMRMEDLDPKHVTLLGPGGAAATRVVAVERGRLAFIRPVTPLFPDSRYTLLIDGVRTAKGATAPLMTLDFKTAALPVEQDPEAMTEQAARPSGSPEGAGVCGDSPNPQICRPEHELRDGVWTPGADNTGGRWRIAAPQPELVNTAIMARVTEAVGFTTLIGQIRQVDGVPVANVEVSVGNNRAMTDANGHFTLHEVPAGHQELYVDGTTANGPRVEYGQFVVGVEIAKGKLTQLPYTMYLPRISERDKIGIPSPLTRDVVLKHPDMPWLMVQVPAGTVIRDRKGRIVRELAIVPTPVNRAPFPVADNYPLYFTLQPGGAVVQGLTPEAAKGIRVFYPNYDRHPKGTQANFWIYDPAEGWRIYGKGRVTSNGKYFSPEAGVALHQTMGGSYSVDQRDPPSEEDKPECNESCGSAQSGGGATAGDPIDLKTGQFFYDETDIVIPDVVPIQIGRSYRPRDLMKRSFGLATTLNYSYKLDATSADGYNLMKLVLPNGSSIPFQRTSGSGLGGTWHQSGSLTSFNNAEITFVGGIGFRLTFTDGSVMQFDKYSPNPLLWMADRYGNRTEFTYDAGLLVRVTSPSGRFVNLEYDTENRIKTARDMLGNSWTYAYDPTSGLLTKVTYPDLTFKQYNYRYRTMQAPECPDGGPYESACDYYQKQYDWGRMLVQHAIQSIVDRRGVKILENEFEEIELLPDYIGRVIKQTLPDGSFYAINYTHLDGDTGGYGTLVTNPDGSQRRLSFVSGQRLPATDTVGYGTPLAQKVAFERGGYGQITARIDALGRRTEYAYDDRGNVTQLTVLAGTPKAKTISMSYNAEGKLTSVTDPLQRSISLSYDDGCLTEVAMPLGRNTRLTCNLAGLPTSVTDPLDRTSYLEYLDYDLAEIRDPLGRWVRFRHDAMGRQVAVEDMQGNVVRREYDAEGRVVKFVDAKGEVTEIGYDANGNVTAVLMPHGNGLTYDYDDQGRLLTRTDALGQEETWTYDAMGRVKTFTDRKGQTTEFTYDVLGRLVTTAYEDGSTITATYDAGNRLRTLTDSISGVLSWDYDDLDQVIQAQTPQGTIAYEYDEVGRRVAMTVAGQARQEYEYDDGDRLQRMLQGSEVVEFDYDDADRLVRTILPNGIKTGYAYNDADQVTGIAWLKPDDSLLGDLGYGYNDVGQRVAQTGSFASQKLPAASTGPNGFDDNNRQTQYNGDALTYDANGNLTSDGTRTYVWNARDQLVEIKQGTSTIARFSYDAVGRRYSRSESGNTTVYLHDGLDPVQETRGAAVKPILTGLGIDQRYAAGTGANRHYFLTDALGSTRLLTDGAGAIVQRYDYDPYGGTQTTTGVANAYRYTGREQDASNLYYYRARYYHPRMGRFISEDPLGLAAGDLNFYAYVGGDPISYHDPLGLWAWGDPLPQELVDFSAAFGDTISFGATNAVRDWMGTNGSVDKCSGSYSAGEWAGVAYGFAAGGAVGWRAAGVKARGMEFSHWIPNRMGGPRSLWNGNYVTTATHALSDPFRYRFMSRAWKAANPMPNQLIQQWVRIPNGYKGAGAGGAAAGVSAAMNGCECS